MSWRWSVISHPSCDMLFAIWWDQAAFVLDRYSGIKYKSTPYRREATFRYSALAIP